MVKTFFKWAGITLLMVIAGLFITVMVNQHKTFEAPYPNIVATDDSLVIARGKHLVFGPAHCATCHVSADMDDRVLRGEVVPLSGGRLFDLPIGNFFTRNLTPHETGIGKWSDAEIARALRYGVSADGRALFDFMPFHHTSDEDLTAIISYLRSQPPVDNKVSANQLNMIGKVVNAFLIKPVGPSDEVPLSVRRDTTALYGKYLANSVANCRGCHTNRNLMTGEFIGEDYAGGLAFETPTDSGNLIITTPNLTPHATGKLRGWTVQQFIGRFRMGKLVEHSHMPWDSFSRMTDEELKAIYNYLQTVNPVDHEIKQTVMLMK